MEMVHLGEDSRKYLNRSLKSTRFGYISLNDNICWWSCCYKSG